MVLSGYPDSIPSSTGRYLQVAFPIHGGPHDLIYLSGLYIYLSSCRAKEPGALILQGCSVILSYPLHVWTSHAKLVGALPKVSHIDVSVCSP